MKAEKKQKPRGVKHKVREEKKREERIGLSIMVITLIAIIFISGFLINSLLNQPSISPAKVSSTSEPKAAIVDQASLSPAGGFNETFTEEATNILKQAGYRVDYYPGEKVNVEFYKKLPTHGHRLIILRVHSAVTQGSTSLGLFTSEPYDKTKYVYDQLADRLVGAAYSEEDREMRIIYFGISPLFVTQNMKGRFENTIIIMTGCEGLTYPTMAEAFIQKGAKVYIGWDKAIFFSHTDAATIHLLQHLLIEKLTLKKSVQETLKEVGFDPAYNSVLIYYPLEAGDYTIQNNIGSQVIVSTIVEIKHKELSKTRYQEIS